MVRIIREWILAEMRVAGTVGKLLAVIGILWASHAPSRAEFISSEASLKIAARVAPHEVVNMEDELHSYELLTVVNDVSAYGWAEMKARGLVMASASGDAIGGQAAFAGQYVKVGGPFLSDAGLWLTGGHVAHRFTTDEEATFHVTMTSDNAHLYWPFGDGSPGPFVAGWIEIYDDRGRRVVHEWLTPTGGSMSIPIGIGEWYLTISVPDSGNVLWAPGGYAEGFVNASVVWGLNGLPGSTPDMPLMPLSDDFILGPNPKHEPPGWKRATDGGGVRGAAPFEAPVDQATGYGLTDPIYFDPVLAEAFGFAALNDTLFTSFIVPSALPQGDEVFTLIFDGMEYERLPVSFSI